VINTLPKGKTHFRKTEENTMNNNAYFQTMNQTFTKYERARTAQEPGLEYPFTDGQTKAYRAWVGSTRSESSLFEVQDLPWPRDIRDFVETLRAAGITEFAVTDRNTGLMEGLHLLAAEGCAMEGLCRVTQKEIFYGKGGFFKHQGTLFHT